MIGLLWVVAVLEILVALLLWGPGFGRGLSTQDKIAVRALLLNIFTFGAAVIAAFVAFRAYQETRRQAVAAEAQTKVARDDQRPWISLAVEPASSLHYLSTDFAQISLEFTVKNEGKSPAINVFLEPQLITSTPDRSAPLAEQARLIAELKAKPDDELSVNAAIMFPGQTLKRIDRISMTDIDKARALYVAAAPTLRNPFLPMFTSCIVYRFTFAAERHFTCLVGALQPKTGSIYGAFFDTATGDVSVDKVEINLVYGGYIN
jgi:hypothetical protein